MTRVRTSQANQASGDATSHGAILPVTLAAILHGGGENVRSVQFSSIESSWLAYRLDAALGGGKHCANHGKILGVAHAFAFHVSQNFADRLGLRRGWRQFRAHAGREEADRSSEAKS